MNSLVAWAVKKDIHINDAVDLCSDGIYGAQGTATREIPENTTIVSIPFTACLTPKVACIHFNLDFAEVARVNLEGPLLALYLLVEKDNPDSVWREYIDALPETFNVPYYWSEEALFLLKGTDLKSEPERRKTSLLKRRGQVLDLVNGQVRDEQVTERQWIWAMTVLSSRSFPSRLIKQFSPFQPETESVSRTDDGQGDVHRNEQGESHPILLPVVDILNHDPATHISWSSNESTQSIDFILHDCLTAGSQVFNNYGPKSSEEFILGYGFCGNNHGVTLQRDNKRYRLTIHDPLPQVVMDMMSQNKGRLHQGLLALVDKMRAKHTQIHETLKQAQSSEDADVKLAREYRDNHLQVVNVVLDRARTILDGLPQISIQDAFNHTIFKHAIETCFSVATVEDAEESGLSDVILTLFLISSSGLPTMDNVEDVVAEDDQRDQAHDLWQQIENCREICPKVFGQVTQEQFTRTITMIWDQSVDHDGILTLYIYSK